MSLHFSRDEFADRRRAVTAAMQAEGLDGLLMFRQESMYWLTGYDSFGFAFFQCLALTADGKLTLLTRAPDLRQAQLTSVIEDIRIWKDGADADPAQDLHGLLEEMGLGGGRIGVEYNAFGLTGAILRDMDRALAGFGAQSDASLLVSRLRLVKSPAEIAFVERASELADDALAAALAETRPGAFEGDILAALQGAIFRGGGDYPANEIIIGSGEHALLVRYFTGRRHLSPTDQLTLEFAGAYRHYHSAMMRTVPVGEVSGRHQSMHEACVEALLACEERLRPGIAMGEVFQAHADVFDGRGLTAHRLNACGYSLGGTFAPCWMDWPMFYADNPVEVAPGMIFFLHMILADSDSGAAMTLGRTSLVTESGARVLSRAGLELAAA